MRRAFPLVTLLNVYNLGGVPVPGGRIGLQVSINGRVE